MIKTPAGMSSGLTVDAALSSLFRSAESAASGGDDEVLFVTACVEGTAVSLRGEGAARGAAGDLPGAFARLAAEALAPPGGPALFLLRGGAAGGKWALISFVPESTAPKKKMLLAAVRARAGRARAQRARARRFLPPVFRAHSRAAPPFLPCARRATSSKRRWTRAASAPTTTARKQTSSRSARTPPGRAATARAP